MNRRRFITNTAVATTLAAGGLHLSSFAGATVTAQATRPGSGKSTFRMKYAPHFKMFRHSAGEDLLDQLKFAADQGFTAWEDNHFYKRPIEEQNRIATQLEKLNMTMGVFVAYTNPKEPTWVIKDKAIWDGILEHMKKMVDIAKRVNAKWLTVVPGTYDGHLDMEYQDANVVELLKRCCDIFEPHDLVMVLEPINRILESGFIYLYRSPQAYRICKAVNRPSCKILFDVYHQQITEGNLIHNIEQCWDEIAYFQIGDNPGRGEPGTGEINFPNILKFIHKKGYQGIIGMEHRNSKKGKAGEQAVIEAYRKVDQF